jgi:hypothetical protein
VQNGISSKLKTKEKNDDDYHHETCENWIVMEEAEECSKDAVKMQ